MKIAQAMCQNLMSSYPGPRKQQKKMPIIYVELGKNLPHSVNAVGNLLCKKGVWKLVLLFWIVKTGFNVICGSAAGPKGTCQ